MDQQVLTDCWSDIKHRGTDDPAGTCFYAVCKQDLFQAPTNMCTWPTRCFGQRHSKLWMERRQFFGEGPCTYIYPKCSLRSFSPRTPLSKFSKVDARFAIQCVSGKSSSGVDGFRLLCFEG